jgi:hypothetical protein
MINIPCIFNDGDYVIQQDAINEFGYALPLKMWNSKKCFYSINTFLKCGMNRIKENVYTMKNFLFEFDSIPLDTQKKLLKKNIGIVSMAVFSGSKSIHFIIQVKDIPDNDNEYRYLWNLMNEKYFMKQADTQCNDYTRLSRSPNAVRDNGVRQMLILNELKPIDLKWRPLYNRINELDLMKKDYRNSMPINRTGKKLTYEAECVLNGDYPKGERDMIIKKGLPWLFYNGYTLDEILTKNNNKRSNPASIKNFYQKLNEVRGK